MSQSEIRRIKTETSQSDTVLMIRPILRRSIVYPSCVQKANITSIPSRKKGITGIAFYADLRAESCLLTSPHRPRLVSIKGVTSSTAGLYPTSEARNSIDETMEIIAEQCLRPSSQPRRNGFEALVKIGKAVLISERNTLGSEVRRLFRDGDTRPLCGEERFQDASSKKPWRTFIISR